MKATVDRKEFANAVKAASLAVNRRADLPILRCLKLSAGGAALEIAGTDLEVGRVRYVAATVDKPGACAVDSKKLGDALKACKADDVTLALGEGGWLCVESGAVNLTLSTLDAEKFPPLPDAEDSWDFCTVPPAALAYLLDKTAFCASTDEGRVNLNGVFLYRDADDLRLGPGLRAVGTDGHRLATAFWPCEGPKIPPLLIPRAALKPLMEMAENAGMTPLDIAVKVGEDGQGVNLAVDGETDRLMVRLIDKEFPDYRQVIPDEVSGTFFAEADELAAALKEVTAISTGRSRPVKFECAANLESLKLSARNYDREESVRSVRVSGLSKGFDPIGFNAKYLLEALAKAKGGTVEFGIGEDFLMPWKMENVCDPLWRYVVMPIRVTS